MKAVVVSSPGGPEVLEVVERQKPILKAGWTLVKIQGFGINHSEIFTRQGLSPSVQFPRVLGIECVGLVEQTTRPDLKIGQQIISIMGEMGRAFDGGYAEYTLLPNEQIYPIKTELDLESLIALPETYYTAFGAFLNLKIEEKDCVLVRGATSGVGIAFAKLLKGKFPEIHLVGTSRNLAKEDQLKAVGFDQVILEKDVYLTTFYSGNVSNEKLQELIDFVELYQVDVRPEKVYRLEEIQEAHTYLESSQSFGKVIVKIEEEYD